MDGWVGEVGEWEGWGNGWVGGWMDGGWEDGWMGDGRVNGGWVGGWMDEEDGRRGRTRKHLGSSLLKFQTPLGKGLEVCICKCVVGMKSPIPSRGAAPGPYRVTPMPWLQCMHNLDLPATDQSWLLAS